MGETFVCPMQMIDRLVDLVPEVATAAAVDMPVVVVDIAAVVVVVVVGDPNF